ncbi:MAG: triose-phosphate isomerase [Myxococcota bacterium]|nr:triose-phosphate isomerase [Myxococcota bacterium]
MGQKRYLFAGNWKMHKTSAEAAETGRELMNVVSRFRDRDIAIFPPYLALEALIKVFDGSHLEVGAQNMHQELKGAYTGEIAAPMLSALGCHRVLIGHSERREYFNETDASVAQKLKLALDHGLRPILCIGEKLEDREAGRTNELVGGQLEAAIAQLSLEELAKVDVAYEPVWAIGTGKVASPQQAQEVHAILRERLRYRDRTLAESMRIVYGGSVKPDNAAELMNKDDVDGALVGGASLKAESFKAIIESI